MLHVGDKVRIKENVYDIKLPWISATEDMNEYFGKTYIIKNIENFSRHKGYILEGVVSAGECYWVWAEEWLELIEEYNIQDDDILQLLSGII